MKEKNIVKVNSQVVVRDNLCICFGLGLFLYFSKMKAALLVRNLKWTSCAPNSGDDSSLEAGFLFGFLWFFQCVDPNYCSSLLFLLSLMCSLLLCLEGKCDEAQRCLA